MVAGRNFIIGYLSVEETKDTLFRSIAETQMSDPKPAKRVINL